MQAAWDEITFHVKIYLLEKETILNDRTFKRSLPLPLYGFSVTPYNDVHKPTQRRLFMFVQAVVYPTWKGFLLDNMLLLLPKQVASLFFDVILSVFMDYKFSWRTNFYSVFTKKLLLQQFDKIYDTKFGFTQFRKVVIIQMYHSSQYSPTGSKFIIKVQFFHTRSQFCAMNSPIL